MLIRSAQLPMLIETLAREGDVKPAAAALAKMNVTHSDLPQIVDPLVELRRSLEGVVDQKVINRALKKTTVLVGGAKLNDVQRAQSLGQGFLALARGAKARAQELVIEDPKPGSASADMSASHIDILGQTALAPLVAAARSKNMFVVVPEALDAKTRAEYEHLFGVPMVGTGDAQQRGGVAIHLGDIKGLDRVPKGELNPMLGDPGIQTWIEDNKWREYLIAKDFMPQTVNAADLLRDNPAFEAQRKRVLALIETYRQHPTAASESKLRRASHMLFEQFTTLSKQLFPAGAFIKYIGEFQTGDRGQVLHTGKKRQAGRAFVADLKAADEQVGAGKRFASRAMQDTMGESSRSATNVVRSLLLNPAAVLVQERMAIAKTRDGFSQEIRIDVVKGVPVNGSLRYGVDYQPEAVKRAAALTQRFFEQKGEQWSSMAAGVDVAVLENGEMAIIEFNFGNQSGFMDPITAPLEGALFLSRLHGEPTPFIARLQEAFAKGTGPEGIAAQAQALDQVIVEDPHRPDRAVGAASYFRDRMLESWLADRSPMATASTRAALRALTERLARVAPKDAKDLLAVSEAYLNENK